MACTKGSYVQAVVTKLQSCILSCLPMHTLYSSESKENFSTANFHMDTMLNVSDLACSTLAAFFILILVIKCFKTPVRAYTESFHTSTLTLPYPLSHYIVNLSPWLAIVGSDSVWYLSVTVSSYSVPCTQ